MAKLTDDQLRFIIDLDASGAQGEANTLSASIHKLEQANKEYAASNRETQKEIAKMEKELSKLSKAGEVGTDKYNKLTKSIRESKQNIEENERTMRKNNATIADSKKKMGELISGLKLSDMTMSQLRARANQLQRQLDLTSRAASPETYHRLKDELAETTQQMSKMRDQQSKVSATLSTFKGNILTIFAGMLWKGFTTTVKKAFDVIVDFEKENATLASVLGTTQDGVKALTDDAKRLGATTAYTASQMTQLQTELAKLGFSQGEILKSTEAVQRFATATGSGLPEAAQLAGAALRSFGLDASEMERVVSTMGVATTKSALDFGYLQNSMSTIAPVAKSFGFTIEDTTAMLGTLANSGFDASSAATATRNILLNLADTNGKLAKRLGEPIKSMDDLIPALRKLQAGGVNLAEALELTDKRSVAAFSTFLAGTDTLEKLRAEITGAGDALKAMEEERLNTVSGSIALLNSAWEGLLLSFSNSKGAIKSVIDWLTELLNKWTEWRNRNSKDADTAISAYELGLTEEAKKGAETKVKGYQAGGTSDEQIREIESKTNKQLKKQYADMKQLYEEWQKAAALGYGSKEALAYEKQLEELGVRTSIYGREDFLSLLGKKKDEITQSDYTLSLVEPKQKTNSGDTGKKGKTPLTDDEYKAELKKLQDAYAQKKAIIIQNEADLKITKEDSAHQQLELAKEQADAELAFARKHHQETGDLQVKAANATMALNRDNYSRMEKDLQNWLSDSLRDEQEAYLKGKINQDAYNQNVRDIRAQHLNKLKELMEQYGMDTSDLERRIAENEIKNRKEADKEILAAAKRARMEALKLNKQNEQNELALLEEKRRLGLVTETQYEMQRRQITDVFAKERLGIEEIYYEAVKNLDAQTVAAAQQAVADATKALDETLQDRLAKAREYTSELRDIFAETAEMCGDTLGGKIMGNMANAMDAISQFQEQLATGSMDMGQKIAAGVQMVGQVASQALQAASQITQQIFEMEANQLEAAKQKELAAVGDNAEAKERIEQEYAQKELDLKKRQADADAAIQTASLWVNTAMGIATAWATSMQLGPIAGPIMAAILTGALLTTAGLQQANIIAQREAIKNQTLESSGGSSAGINDSTASVSTTSIRDEYKPGGQGYSDGGYTGDGGVHEPAGVVHKGEYVVSQAELKNPAVVSMVRSIEGVRQSRKHGRAGTHGFADGGYTSEAPSTGELTDTLAELRDEIRALRTEKIHADVNYHEFKEVERKINYIQKKGSK